ncbi:fluoride efflux transporter FluC [Trueperella pecoris]|uniref:fluoride efflux transporter FluC n=1 Tax=Trueperella pecoris TaxID=2733571 RepID=UPI00186B70DD|nr:CrcB family protein [Trueperella pecoris]QOQ38957.1 CrcB family protein [Trueperella pecoris]
MNALLVGLGGAIGAVLRHLMTLGSAHPVVAIFGINIAGAFLLGLLAATVSGKPRLFLGTGILGGFTTYSALAVDTVRLLHDAAPLGLLYLVASLAIGVIAAGAGMLSGTKIQERLEARAVPAPDVSRDLDAFCSQAGCFGQAAVSREQQASVSQERGEE